jgi:hypothetical protein
MGEPEVNPQIGCFSLKESIAQGGLCAGLAPGHWSREAAHL